VAGDFSAGRSVAGIDQIGTTLLLVEMGTEMATLGSAERHASWVGICSGNHIKAAIAESSLRSRFPTRTGMGPTSGQDGVRHAEPAFR